MFDVLEVLPETTRPATTSFGAEQMPQCEVCLGQQQMLCVHAVPRTSSLASDAILDEVRDWLMLSN